MEEWRENWEKIVNEKFAEKGLTCRIDHRSNEKRGFDEIPQVHEGSAVRRMEQRGIATYKGAWNKWVKRTNDNIRRLLNALRELTEWIKEARERVHRIENPTISNMVMTYYEHRDEVAKGYERGTKKAQLGNLQYVSKVQVYIEQNNLTTIDDVEKVISEKNDLLKQAKDGLDNKKAELKRIKKNLSLIDDYYENKPVYEESRKIFFKAKQNEYREKHHAEISKFQKAKRILSEQGYDEPSFELCREMWTEKMTALEEEIKTESEKIKNDPINQEVKMLDYIRDAVDFVTNKNSDDDDDDDNGNNSSASSGGESAIKSDDEAVKKAQEQETQEQAMQTARMQAQQQTLANQSGHRERVSMKAKLGETIEIVRKSEERKRSVISQEHDETKRKKRQTSL